MLGNAFDPNSPEYLAAVAQLQRKEGGADAADAGEISVTFENGLQEQALVHFLPGGNEPPMQMLVLPAAAEGSLSSFHSHAFSATRAAGGSGGEEVGRWELDQARDGRQVKLVITEAGIKPVKS